MSAPPRLPLPPLPPYDPDTSVPGPPVVHSNRAFQGAYRKGWEARRSGEPLTANPYPDYMAGRYAHVTTWSRAYRRYWADGWKDAGKPRTPGSAGSEG